MSAALIVGSAVGVIALAMSGAVSTGRTVGAGAVLLAAVCVVRAALGAARGPARREPEDAYVGVFRARAAALCDALAAAVRLRTISHEPHNHGRCGAQGEQPEHAAAAGGDAADGPAAMRAMHVLLAERFPAAHARCEVHVVNELSLVYVLRGSDEKLKPVLFMAHMDVVPCPQSELWTVPPFEGRIDESFVWGRGTIDDKNCVLALLGALETVAARAGRPPLRTLVVALGHDEEIGGHEGAAHIARFFKAQGMHFEFVLDEGGFIISGLIPRFSRPIATINTGEKGSVTMHLTVDAVGGHSSNPPAVQAISVMATALKRLEARPLPPHMHNGPVMEFLKSLAPYLPFAARLVLCNTWLFGPLLGRVLGALPNIRTLVRTTVAFTIFKSGIKTNVMPGTAFAVVNHRIHPADTVADVIAHDIAAIADPRVRVEAVHPLAPAPVSDSSSRAFGILAAATVGAYPGALAVPSLCVGNTDTCHFWALADNIYRFSPVALDASDIKRFHGIDERISIDSYVRQHAFYARVMEEAAWK